MKRTLKVFINTSAASLLAFSAVAQDSDKSRADRPHDTRQPQHQLRSERLQGAVKASDIVGMTVKNLQDEKLGKVETLMVDLSSGRVVAVIISSGGFLGLGDTLSAVPSAALRFTNDRDALQLDASRKMLADSPHFTADRWPDFTDPAYADGVYRAYNVEPYFTTNSTTWADNSARNVRDRQDQTVTPFDQGNSTSDVNTTAAIRKEIVAGKTMSVNARNVKIITNAGRVTLRGPVNTAEEKQLIGEIAARIAGLANVDNQLEVKLTTSSTE
jgi:hyperosmotically inducible periplasmic protein